jgi:arylsulfatase A-like enzyme
MKSPNILFLTVDALRADRMSLHGYNRPTTPSLEKLAARAMVFDEAVSLASFTQPSYPSILTSSRPLSFGGYDHGAFGRPATVFEKFHDERYETYALSTFQWVSRIAGYDRGIDHEISLFVLNTLVGVASVILRNHIERFRDSIINAEELAGEAEPHLMRLFDVLEHYVDNVRTQSRKDEFRHSRLRRDSYDYDRVQRICQAHKAAFLADKTEYVQKHFMQPFQAHEWLGKEWRLARQTGGLIREATGRIVNRTLASISPSRASARAMAAKRYVDGGALADRIIRAMKEHKGDKPFMIWTHFLDTHVPYCPGRAGKWHREAGRYLAALGYDSRLDPAIAVSGRPQTPEQWEAWSAFYDATVLYVDEQIGRIVDSLDEMGLAEETLIVFCADHGEELGDHGDISHHFRLYSHNVRVPLMFAGAGVTPGRSEALATLIDILPSMTEIAGIVADDSWEGKSVFSPEVAGRSNVVLESFHGGSCAFDHKPAYMAARDRRFNFLWKEFRDPSDKYSLDGPELYDTVADPDEQQNIYDPSHPSLPEFEQAIFRRLTEIPEFKQNRFDGKFATIAATGQKAKAK